jgi:2-oxoglutarate/2-oxoacid ferredoxin oxidoreductase subunit alpha
LPVSVLTEQALCQSKATLAPLDIDKVHIDRGKLIDEGEVVFGEYKRFAFTEDGVSPRVIPGIPGGMHLAPGSEHNDAGVITENPRNRARMMEKRMGKLVAMRDDLPRPVLHGIADADIAIVGYGANRGPIAEAVQRLAAGGVLTRFLQLRTLWPFPDDDIKEFVRGAQHVFVVENNYTGQLMQLIRAVVGPLDALHGLRKYDGQPFRPIEIIEPIRRMAEVDEAAEVH